MLADPYIKVIPEVVVKGHRLGRHVRHDPRSFRYPFRAPTVELVSRRWSTDDTPILDQGDIGACTGNATVAAFLCDNDNPLRNALTPEQTSSLSQELATLIYSNATEIDPFEGTYPPVDTGSDGLSVAKAAQALGLISGYSHAFTIDDVLAALTTGPVIVGVPWYSGFEDPRSDGLVVKRGPLRGGHEVCLDEIDVSSNEVWFRNSWTAEWGIDGRACMYWDTLEELLAEEGDATVFSPVDVPAPIPVPEPEPAPEPEPIDTSAEDALYDGTVDWVNRTRFYKKNEEVRQLLLEWRKHYEGKNE